VTLRPCLDCGSLVETGPRCTSCAPPDPRPHAAARGYDHAWRKLSTRARRLQPFCSDCGDVENLTVDHSPEAWERYERGLPIRLADIEVVCGPCNTRRGSSRPSTWGVGVSRSSSRPSGKAKFGSHTPGGMQ